MTDWVIGPRFPFSDPSCEAKRVEFQRFLSKYCLVACLLYGIVLVAKERRADGKILSVVCALPPGKSYIVDGTKILPLHPFRIRRRLVGTRAPDAKVFGKDTFKRMGFLRVKLQMIHDPAEAASAASNAEGTPPWYVFLLRTDVDAQGKGCGTAPLDAIHYLADSDGTDTMLEYSWKKKQRFYCQKMGYQDFGDEILLKDPKKNKNGYDRVVPLIAAIRSKRQPRLPS